MPRLPSSLKWLIDRRARVAGEIEKIEAALAKCQRLSDEVGPLKQLLAAVDQTLQLHDVAVDVTLIPVIKSKDFRIELPYGELTRAILMCLKINVGFPVSTDEITAFLATRYVSLEGETCTLSDLRLSVRYRLKNLRRQGLVELYHKRAGKQAGLWLLARDCKNEVA